MTIKEDFSEPIDFVSKYWYLAVLPIMAWGFISIILEDDDIDSHHAEVMGLVYDWTPIVKHPSKRNYDYEFFISGKRYTGSSSAYLSNDVDPGEYYLVEYSYENPEHSRMTFTHEYIMKTIEDSTGAVTTKFLVKNKQEE